MTARQCARLLLALAESVGGPAPVLHAAGLALVAARVAHAWGMSQVPEDFRFRVGGMMTTFGVIFTLSALCVAGAAGLLKGF
jgi:uncharacterized membrane protein YecN with MAPEG domain